MISERTRRLASAERLTPPDRASTIPARRAGVAGTPVIWGKII